MQSMLYVADGRWVGPHGIGRFAREVFRRLPNLFRVEKGCPLLHPMEPLWLTGLLLRLRPRVYFSPGFNPPLWSSVPLVFTIHDLIHLRFTEESSRQKRAYYRLVVQPAAKMAHAILTVSEFSKGEIVEWANLPDEKVVVVGNGVGSEFTPNGPKFDPGYPYLLYVGNRKPHKNLRRLLEAFARSGLATELRLLLSGNPDEETFRHIRDFGLQGRVVFTGIIADSDLPAYYRGALALLFPSLYEGFGLPPLEAMACGTPVVTSNITSLPEVVGTAAVLVDPYDVDSIAWGIRRVVEDHKLRAELARLGLQRAKLFSWDRTAEKVWKVIKEAALDSEG